MNRFVVDASVGMKWFVAETDSDAAVRLQDPANELHIPGFFDIEVANSVWKKRRRGELSRAEADFIIGQLPLLPVTRHPEAPLLPAAFDLADRTQRTVYDCLYLALAVQLAAPMVTADQRLYNALQGRAEAAHILWVGNVP